MSRKEKMSSGEIQVILGVLVFNGKATTGQLAYNFDLSDNYVRNITVLLRKKKTITSLRHKDIRTGIRFGSPLFDSSFQDLPKDNKEKLHILTIDYQSLLKEYPEILEWTNTILGIKTPAELKAHLKKLRGEIIEKQESEKKQS